ncbi:hypothetical protein [Pseudomonas sp. AMR01]|uniref:hypothetical protein n=1 Tax=Pseudomonas sp. AMR01 TaxID=3064904 RepID=UPI0035C0AFD9
MDAFQWQYDPADGVEDEHQAQLLRDTMNRFESQIDEVWSRLQFTRGFRLADLAVENELELMWNWWVFINSSAGREEMGITTGKFSYHGKQSRMDEDHEPPRMIEVHRFYNRPGQSPIPVSNRSVRSFTTDVDEVIINGKRVTDSVIVVFDSETPAPSRREIVNAAYSGRGMIRARRIADARAKGDYARLQRLLDEPSPATDFVDLFEPVQAHKLFKTLTSVAPLIRGYSPGIFTMTRDSAKRRPAELRRKNYLEWALPHAASTMRLSRWEKRSTATNPSNCLGFLNALAIEGSVAATRSR